MRSDRSIPCWLLHCVAGKCVWAGSKHATDGMRLIVSRAGLAVLSWKDAHRGREQSSRVTVLCISERWVLDGPLLLLSHIPVVGPRIPPMIPSRAIIANLTNLHADTRPGNDAIYEGKEAPQIRPASRETSPINFSPSDKLETTCLNCTFRADKDQCRPAPLSNSERSGAHAISQVSTTICLEDDHATPNPQRVLGQVSLTGGPGSLKYKCHAVR